MTPSDILANADVVTIPDPGGYLSDRLNQALDDLDQTAATIQHTIDYISDSMTLLGLQTRDALVQADRDLSLRPPLTNPYRLWLNLTITIIISSLVLAAVAFATLVLR